VDRARVGKVLRLERVPVEPDPMIEYTSIGIRSFGKGIFHYEPKLGAQLGSLRFFEVRPDRLVVSNIKGWEGAIAVSSTADAGHLASNRFLSYVPIDDRIDVRWARWYFLSEPGLELIRRASPGSADRNRTLAIERFEALEIPLPPIHEQRRVASWLARIAHGTDALGCARVTAGAVASAVPT
jgi:type I restriction enzyme S subunit